MRTNPRRAAYVAIQLAVASNTIFFTGLAQAQQGRLKNPLKKATGRTTWFNTSALNATKNHTEVKMKFATQKLSESGLRDLHHLRSELAQ